MDLLPDTRMDFSVNIRKFTVFGSFEGWERSPSGKEGVSGPHKGQILYFYVFLVLLSDTRMDLLPDILYFYVF